MKYETYCGIVSLIHQHSRPGDRKKCMKILLRDFPGFDVQTLGSIYSQEILKKVSGMMMMMMMTTMTITMVILIKKDARAENVDRPLKIVPSFFPTPLAPGEEDLPQACRQG